MGVTVLVGGRGVAVDGISVPVGVIPSGMVGEKVIGSVTGATASVWGEGDGLATVDGLARSQAEKKHPAARR